MLKHMQPNFMFLGQDENCAILRKHLKEYGVSVELGTELVSFEQDETGVDVTLKTEKDGVVSEDKIRTSFVLGSDGAKSMFRCLCPRHY